ncbi:MAG: N-acetylmuramoyl-L-alanine amidase [Nitrospirae bacterium]|nr:N-acetylmuramoyl-L-alanine amidase [Nitrospirota bacterium]
MQTLLKNIIVAAILILMLSSVSALAAEVSMTVSEKEGYIRVEFASTEPSFIKEASVVQSYSLLKVTFPSEFTLKQNSSSKLIQKVSQKENSVFLNIDNLSVFNTSTQDTPPKFILEAYIKESVKNTEQKHGSISTIVIDPGHGGQETGLLFNVKSEGNIDLEFALGIADALKASKYKVVFTRNIDKYLSIDDRISPTYKLRGYLFISIHLSRANKCVIYTSKFPSSPTGTLNISGNDLYNTLYSQTAFLDTSKKLADTIGNTLKDGSGIDVRHLEMPITLLSSIYAPAIMIELPNEIGVNNNPERNKKIINLITQGIDKFVKE